MREAALFGESRRIAFYRSVAILPLCLLCLLFDNVFLLPICLCCGGKKTEREREKPGEKKKIAIRLAILSPSTKLSPSQKKKKKRHLLSNHHYHHHLPRTNLFSFFSSLLFFFLPFAYDFLLGCHPPVLRCSQSSVAVAILLLSDPLVSFLGCSVSLLSAVTAARW